MSRRLSLNARLAHEDEFSGEIEVMLFVIEHPELDAPIRLSTDNAVRISTDPEIYGTVSSWRGGGPANPYLWVVASAVLPGDSDDAPAAATLSPQDFSSSRQDSTPPSTISTGRSATA